MKDKFNNELSYKYLPIDSTGVYVPEVLQLSKYSFNNCVPHIAEQNIFMTTLF